MVGDGQGSLTETEWSEETEAGGSPQPVETTDSSKPHTRGAPWVPDLVAPLQEEGVSTNGFHVNRPLKYFLT